MALLKRIPSPALGLVLLASASAGCFVFEALAPGRRELVFSHRLHIEEEQLDCVSCHEGAEVEEAPGMPSPDSCGVCHDVIDRDKPAERAVATLFDGELFHGLRANQLEVEVRFSHRDHVTAIQDCSRCHAGIERDQDVAGATVIDMAACIDCHDASGRRDECATCHTAVDRAWAPPGHALDWTRRHGRAARDAHATTVDDCTLCHEPSSCETCHRLDPPESHDAHFRRRGHGLLAQIDRGSCATCHEPATCDRCHAETLPLSHAGAQFGGRRNLHCITCHFPLQNESCSTCHRATPSHALGPAKPSWHNAAMNCRGCHGTSLPLSHVENGSNCNLCHP